MTNDGGTQGPALRQITKMSAKGGTRAGCRLRLSKMSVFLRRRGRCPHRPTVKTAIIICFRRIRNIHKRADVGIGPYEAFFDRLSRGFCPCFFLSRRVQHIFDKNPVLPGRIIYQNVSHLAHLFSVLDDRRAGRERLSLGTTFCDCISATD